MHSSSPFSSPLCPSFRIKMWHLINPYREILFPHSERSQHKVRHWAPTLQLTEIQCLIEAGPITTLPLSVDFISFRFSFYIFATASFIPSIWCLPQHPCLTLGVHFLWQFQGIGVGQVSVGRSDGQDQAALSGDELHDHVPDLLLNVRGLVSDWHLSDPRKVDESQVQHCTTRGRQYKNWPYLFDISATPTFT